MKILFLAFIMLTTLNACSRQSIDRQTCADLLIGTIGICPGMGLDSVHSLMKKLGFDSVLISKTEKGITFSVSDFSKMSKKAFYSIIIESRNRTTVERMDIFASENFDKSFISRLLRLTSPKILTTEFSTNYIFKDVSIQRIKIPGAVNYEIKSIRGVRMINDDTLQNRITDRNKPLAL